MMLNFLASVKLFKFSVIKFRAEFNKDLLIPCFKIDCESAVIPPYIRMLIFNSILFTLLKIGIKSRLNVLQNQHLIA